MPDPDLATITEELYTAPPAEFVRLRAERSRAARATGDRELAERIGQLRKPAVAAWAVNLLVRREPEPLARLLELGAQLRSGQGRLSPPELRELGTRRHRLLAELLGRATALAGEHGQGIGPAVAEQIETTLQAALADPDAEAELRRGTLSAPLSYTGFGPVSPAPAKAGSAPEPARPAPAKAGSAPAESRSEPARPGPEVARPRPAERAPVRPAPTGRAAVRPQPGRPPVEAQLAAARSGAERAEQQARAAAERVERATGRHRDAEARVQELQQELVRARAEVLQAARELDAARRGQRQADTAADRARAELARLRR